MKNSDGVCPLCETTGLVGGACGEKICSKRGMHFIPTSYYSKISAQSFQSRDSMLGSLVDDYLIAGVVGEGGFGKVYLALQLPIMMPSALKLMSRSVTEPDTARRMVDKFKGEALSLSRLHHPNIVRLLKYGTIQETPYMVMEFVKNSRTLKDDVAERVMRGDTFEMREVHHILVQVLNGLDSAHELKIVHRDIKPENIMLQRVKGDQNFVRILDFGLAKFVAERTATSIVIGTPIYMAPEQLARRHIGPWTDLYAVGVMVFEMLTGRRPFDGRTTQELISQKLDPRYNPLTLVEDLNLDDGLKKMLRRALARDMTERFRSADEFRHSLNEIFERLERGPEQKVAMTGMFNASELQKLVDERAALDEDKKRLQAEKLKLETYRAQMQQEAENTRQRALAEIEAEKKRMLGEARRQADEERKRLQQEIHQLKKRRDSLEFEAPKTTALDPSLLPTGQPAATQFIDPKSSVPEATAFIDPPNSQAPEPTEFIEAGRAQPPQATASIAPTIPQKSPPISAATATPPTMAIDVNGGYLPKSNEAAPKETPAAPQALKVESPMSRTGDFSNIVVDIPELVEPVERPTELAPTQKKRVPLNIALIAILLVLVIGVAWTYWPPGGEKRSDTKPGPSKVTAKNPAETIDVTTQAIDVTTRKIAPKKCEPPKVLHQGRCVDKPKLKPQPGDLGAACRPNNACNGDLVCFQTRCRTRQYVESQRPKEQIYRIRVSSRRGWTGNVRLELGQKFMLRVTGSWTVDKRTYRRVGYRGHTDERRTGLIVHSAWKYDRRYPFGALLLSVGKKVSRVSINSMSPVTRAGILRLRINDKGFGDNAGQLLVTVIVQTPRK